MRKKPEGLLPIVLMISFLVLQIGLNVAIVKVNAWSSDEPTICFMFDDGYLSTHTYAYAVMETHGIKGGVAIIANHVNSTFEDIPTMDWGEINFLRRKGWDIYGHGYDHVSLNTLSVEGLQQELNVSYQWISRNSTTPLIHVLAGGTGYNNATAQVILQDIWFAHRMISYGDPANSETWWNITSTSELGDYLWFNPNNVSLYGNDGHNVPIAYDIATTALKFGAEETPEVYGNNSFLIGKELIDNCIANFTGKNAVTLITFHHLVNTWAEVRGLPYCDSDIANFTAIIDYAVSKQTSGDIKISTLNRVFSQRQMSTSISNIIPAIVSLCMLGMAIGLIKKFTK